MRKYENYDKVQAVFPGEYESLQPGGYICKILKVVAEEKEYGTLLRISFDIAEGLYKDFYKTQFERKKKYNPDAKWPGSYYQTVNQDKLSYFKGFITSIEESNPGFKWDWNEQKLVGKLFGGVFGEEEFVKSDGTIGTIVRCRFIRSVDTIRDGDYKIPSTKKLSPSTKIPTQNNFTAIDASNDDDLPF